MPIFLANFHPHAVLRRTFDSLFKIQFIKPDGNFYDDKLCKAISRLDKPNSIQSEAYRVLAHSSFDPEVFNELNRRMSRWNFSEESLYSSYLGRVSLDAQRTSLALFRENVPQRILNAVFLTWFNSWISPRRFGNEEDRKCVFCLEDCPNQIEHFAVCRTQIGLGEYFLNLKRSYSIKTFLCLGDEPLETIVDRCIHLYILKKAYDAQRFNESSSHDWILKRYAAELCNLVGHFPRLRRPYFETRYAADVLMYII